MNHLIGSPDNLIKTFLGKEHIITKIDHEAENFEIDVKKMRLNYSITDYKEGVIEDYQELLYGLRDENGLYIIVGTYKSLDYEVQDIYRDFLIANGINLDLNYLIIKKL